VIARSPESAPPRPDLSWLRHRSSRALAEQPAAPKAAPSSRPAAGAASLDLSAPATSTTATTSLDLTPPLASASLDLSGPDHSDPLDLSSSTQAPPTVQSSPAAQAAPTVRPPRRRGLTPDSPATAPPAAAASAAAPPARAAASSQPTPVHPVRAVRRVHAGQRAILTPAEPTVTLNRLQSGIGVLTIEALCSPAVGDVRIGAAYQLSDGSSSVVQYVSGIVAAPAGLVTALLTTYHSQYEGLTVNLRLSRRLSRLALYAFSESGAPIAWAGTIVCTLFGGARVEVPLEYGTHQGPVVALSLYNVDGEFVLRAERELILGDVREAARAFGYDQITWIDSRTPLR
jgi:hypothetical protein